MDQGTLFNRDGQTITWEISESGTLTLEGEGATPDWDRSGNRVPWADCRERIREVVAGEGITGIGNRAFEGCESLSALVLPGSIRTIGSYAFRGCRNLREVTLAEGSFPVHTFDRWTERRKGCFVFGLQAFRNVPWAGERWGNFYIAGSTLICCFCDGDVIQVPGEVRKLGDFCFQGLRMKELILHRNIRSMGSYILEDSTLETLRMPLWLEDVSPRAFAYSRLRNIDFAERPGWRFTTDHLEDTLFRAERAKRAEAQGTKRIYPKALYEVVGRRDVRHYGGFERLTLRERRVPRFEGGTIGMRSIDVGACLMARMARRAVTGIIWSGGVVIRVESFTWAGPGLYNEYLLYPCVDGGGELSPWRDSFTCQERDDLRAGFPMMPGEELMEEKTLRPVAEGMHEEWFCSADVENYGGPLELELLEKWLLMHPDVRVQTIEENREKDPYRMFVPV